MNKKQKKRLQNLVKVLRESKHPEQFDMGTYMHSCGTPACVFGHYAARPDTQKLLIIRNNMIRYRGGPDYDFAHFHHYRVQEHFGITKDETHELFSAEYGDPDDDEHYQPAGCGGAKTAEEAAQFIEKFIERKEAEQKAGA